MWVDAATIAEEEYNLSGHAKAGSVAMGGISGLLAAPVAAVAAPAVISQGSQMAGSAYMSGSNLAANYYGQIVATGAVAQQAYQRASPMLARITHSQTLHGFASDGTFVSGLKPGALGGWFPRGHVINPFYRTNVAANKAPTQLEFGFVNQIDELNPSFVMYKARDFDPSMLRPGEYTLNLPFLKNSKGAPLDDLNWLQNQNELFKAHGLGKPIRELNPLAEGGWLQRERITNVFEGWKYDDATSLWLPPSN
jgi:hypothetical protein